MTELCLYQTVHVANFRPRMVEKHAALLTQGARELFGCAYTPRIGELEERIAALARAERFPRAVSGFVRIELTAEGRERLLPAGSSLYAGYALRSLMPEACVVEYEIPFGPAFTSAHEAMALLARRQAEAAGADTAIRCDRRGVCYAVDEAPLFAVCGKRILTAPAPQSVERDLACRAIRRAGLEVAEEPVVRDDLARLDELFFVDHRGVTALSRCEGVPYMSLLAERVANAMEKLFE